MKACVYFLLVVLCLGGSSSYAWGSEETNEVETSKTSASLEEIKSTEERGRLIAELFQNYDNRNYPSNITLRFGISLLKIDVDEYKNTIEVDLWQRLVWNDPRLKWNPAEYGGQKVLRLSPQLVWKPDLALYNSASRNDPSACTDTNILIYPEGKVLWVPPCQVKAYCNLSLDVAPYGEQHCNLKFGSWTFDGFSMDLQFYDDKNVADVTDLWDITEWEITGNKAVREEKYYDCCKEPYVSINYNISFQRRSNSAGNSGSCGEK